ncbi:hypothetical protein QMZ05_12530 [Bradyrhizobium sp. INPA03-11B]|uniref:hypothetical protein n=1 Tax=Bradyrhizobium sp. INPA03-11B TaxID=418598 RepID=UPI0033904F19
MSDLIQALDEALAEAGEPIRLRRTVGTQNRASSIVDIQARVNSPTARQMVGTVTQDDLFCIFSPTEINNAQWPGGHDPSSAQDVRIPSKTLGDSVFVRGRWRDVEWAQGFYPGGELCRIEVRVSG